MTILLPENNTFGTVMVDLTHRCNMNCANCYLPDRTPPDMDITRLEACLAKFPRRTNVRLAGGEPTLRSDLPEIITRIRNLGHRPVLLTNGLRLARKAYVDDLRNAGLRHVYISLNGAGNDDWYEHIDNLRCAAKKIQAVENVIANRMFLNTGTILVRGVNEGAMSNVMEMIRAFKPRHALLRFKNVGALGRYDEVAERQNLSMPELENLAARAIGYTPREVANLIDITGLSEANTKMFPIDPTSKPGQGIWIKLINWQVDEKGFVDPKSARRGRITSEFKVAPFFEDVKQSVENPKAA